MPEREISETERKLQDLRYAVLKVAEQDLRKQWPGNEDIAAIADKLVEIVMESKIE